MPLMGKRFKREHAIQHVFLLHYRDDHEQVSAGTSINLFF